jgi:hypothetical protein
MIKLLIDCFVNPDKIEDTYREEFEEHHSASDINMDLTKLPDGTYKQPHTEEVWQAWRSTRSLEDRLW